MHGKVSRVALLKMLLLLIAAFAFVAAAHVAIFFLTGSVASDAVTAFVWGGGMIIGLVLPLQIYRREKAAHHGPG